MTEQFEMLNRHDDGKLLAVLTIPTGQGRTPALVAEFRRAVALPEAARLTTHPDLRAVIVAAVEESFNRPEAQLEIELEEVPGWLQPSLAERWPRFAGWLSRTARTGAHLWIDGKTYVVPETFDSWVTVKLAVSAPTGEATEPSLTVKLYFRAAPRPVA